MNESGPLNLYKRTILWTKLSETLQELKLQGQITQTLEKKIYEKFDEIMCDEMNNLSKNRNTIKGKVTSFRNCDDIWIFYCKNCKLKLEKTEIQIEKLKIIALDEKLKKKDQNKNKNLNPVGEG